MEIDEEKYEHRRLKLIELRDSRFNGVNAALAREIDRDETYENRLSTLKTKKAEKDWAMTWRNCPIESVVQKR